MLQEPNWHTIDRAILGVAENQHGRITTPLLDVVGCDRNGRAWRVRRGFLEPECRGVYRVGGAASHNSDWVTALLAIGEDAALTGVSSVHARGRTRFVQPHLDVVCPRQITRNIVGLRPRRSPQVHPDRMTVVNGIRVMDMPWTITDLGMDLTRHQIANVIHANLFHEWFDIDDVARTLELRGRQRGGAHVRAAVDLHIEGSAGTRSFSEDKWLEIALDVWRRPPTVNTVRWFDDVSIEPDFLWEREGLIVEIDSRPHGRPYSASDDRRRDRAYRAAGFRVVRVQGLSAWRSPRACGQTLRDALSDRRIGRSE